MYTRCQKLCFPWTNHRFLYVTIHLLSWKPAGLATAIGECWTSVLCHLGMELLSRRAPYLLNTSMPCTYHIGAGNIYVRCRGISRLLCIHYDVCCQDDWLCVRLRQCLRLSIAKLHVQNQYHCTDRWSKRVWFHGYHTTMILIVSFKGIYFTMIPVTSGVWKDPMLGPFQSPCKMWATFFICW